MKGEEPRREFLFQPPGHPLDLMKFQLNGHHKMTPAPHPRLGPVCSSLQSFHDRFQHYTLFPLFFSFLVSLLSTWEVFKPYLKQLQGPSSKSNGQQKPVKGRRGGPQDDPTGKHVGGAGAKTAPCTAFRAQHRTQLSRDPGAGACFYSPARMRK